MQINTVDLVNTAFTPAQYVESGLPEIAVVGRSNAGKSSLINTLCNRKIARVSQQPGKTRSINAFVINGQFALMDLPGYGFAKRSAQEQQSWQGLVNGYFSATKQLLHLLLLCDIRHDASSGDLQMVEWLRHYAIPYTLIATKADKIAKSKRAHYLGRLRKQVGEPTTLAFSALDSGGKTELLAHLDDILSTKNSPLGD